LPVSYFINQKYKAYLDNLGVNGERVFRKAGIPLKMEKRGLYVGRQQYIDFMNVLAEESTDEMMLLYSNVREQSMFIPPIFAGLCANNGRECFERLSAYKRLIGPFVLNVTVLEKVLRLEFTFDDELKTPLPRFTGITESLFIVNIIRAGTGKQIIPLKVESPYAYSKRIVEHIGVEPVKSDKNTISFKLADVEEPYITENNIMWHYLEPELKKRKEEMETDNSFAAKVRTILFELIPSGKGNIETVAREMALSPRTLQRKLSEDGTTFIQQLNHTRELMARHYLLNDNITSEEVAYLIGYCDVYAFMRAFRQWTGVTIGQYREKHRIEVGEIC